MTHTLMLCYAMREIREIRIRPRLHHCKCWPCNALRQPGSVWLNVLVSPGVASAMLRLQHDRSPCSDVQSRLLPIMRQRATSGEPSRAKVMALQRQTSAEPPRFSAAFRHRRARRSLRTRSSRGNSGTPACRRLKSLSTKCCMLTEDLQISLLDSVGVHGTGPGASNKSWSVVVAGRKQAGRGRC